MATRCANCKAKLGIGSTVKYTPEGQALCPTCTEEFEQLERRSRRQVERQEDFKAERLKERAAGMLLTTTPSVDGYHIRQYLGIESVEYVLGTGVFAEVVSDVRDFFGMRSPGFESKLQKAKRQAFDDLRLLAAERKANAVVGIDVDYVTFTGNRIGLVITGTLVQVVPLDSEDDSE